MLVVPFRSSRPGDFFCAKDTCGIIAQTVTVAIMPQDVV
jgi:hypothetical protein